jgi:hypothetical protein
MSLAYLFLTLFSFLGGNKVGLFALGNAPSNKRSQVLV